jgi:protein-S-isoprenylcysteine O-methyltransferase Ste14
MISEKVVDSLVETSQKPRSWRFKMVAILIGVLAFLAIVPAVLFLGAYAIDKYALSDFWTQLELGFSIGAVVLGLLLALWTVLSQVRIGKGTPVPLAPPEKLIVTGPYRWCRNPLQLGVMIYYLGIGTFFGSLRIGVLMFLIGLVIGSFYHKFIEEKELRRRFGKEYDEYRDMTPFLFPRLWR